MKRTKHSRASIFQLQHRLAFTAISLLVLASIFVGAQVAQGQTVKGSKEITLYTFTGGADGGSPNSTIVRDS